jgi:putative transposase
MPRIARVVIPHYPHHITQRGTNKNSIFFDDKDRNYFLACLNDRAKKTETKIWAYCLMDNHFHLLLVPEQEQSLGKCLHGTTFRYAQYYNQKYGRTGRLWQNRYFSCPIDRDEYLWTAARYIERNPVRANMVKRAEDWVWSSAGVHIKGKGNKIPKLSDWLDEAERGKYQGFVNEEGSEDEIRRATSTGRPLGSIRFVEKLEEKLGRRLRPQKAGRPKRSQARKFK